MVAVVELPEHEGKHGPGRRFFSLVTEADYKRCPPPVVGCSGLPGLPDLDAQTGACVGSSPARSWRHEKWLAKGEAEAINIAFVKLMGRQHMRPTAGNLHKAKTWDQYVENTLAPQIGPLPRVDGMPGITTAYPVPLDPTVISEIERLKKVSWLGCTKALDPKFHSHAALIQALNESLTLWPGGLCPDIMLAAGKLGRTPMLLVVVGAVVFFAVSMGLYGLYGYYRRKEMERKSAEAVQEYQVELARDLRRFSKSSSQPSWADELPAAAAAS